MRVEGQIDIDAPPDEVWELIGDPCCYPTFMACVTRWEQKGDQRTGLGARYVARFQVGSAPVGGLIEISEFNRPCDLAWTTVTGIEHRGRWRLRPSGSGTTVHFRIAYHAPGGLLGLIADRVADPMVQRLVDDTLSQLKAKVEGSQPPRPVGRRLPNALKLVGESLQAATVFGRTGLLRPIPPGQLLAVASAVRHWGLQPATAAAMAAARSPDTVAVVDEGGSLTYRQLDERSNALAHALRRRHHIGPDSVAGILCRNHRGFVESFIALAKLGADVVLLNTGFSAKQLSEVCADEKVGVIIHDAEFSDAVKGAEAASVVADEIDELLDPETGAPPAPPRPGRVVILTSGTTGRPKGAGRSAGGRSVAIGPAMAIFSRIPYRVGDTTAIAPPLFHAWGFGNLLIALATSSTMVLRQKFDPEAILADIDRNRARVLVAVPVMLQALVDLPESVRQRYDTSSLEVVAVSGSALPGTLAQRFMDAYGDVLYNLYGSTEVAWATIADPQQLRAAPGTSGTPPRGTTVKILDDQGIEQPRGRRGRIFVGNGMAFSGYTGGGGKTTIRGLVDTGDVGHFDHAGRLAVEGRSDDMIVSGGENVFPQEVEDLLSAHPAVADVAVVGVDDQRFGQRLAAFVVPRAGTEPDADQLKEYVRDHLARYKVPRDVEFCEQLPRNASGKVLRRQLRESPRRDPARP
jgi:fatty-acyl-CoA synthase